MPPSYGLCAGPWICGSQTVSGDFRGRLGGGGARPRWRRQTVTSKYRRLSSCGTALIPGTLYVCSCCCQLGFSGLVNNPRYTRIPRESEDSRRQNRWDIYSRFSYETLGLLDDAFGKRHLELCLAAEGEDGWECGVAWLRVKIKVGWW